LKRATKTNNKTNLINSTIMKISRKTKIGLFVLIVSVLTFWGIYFLKGIDIFHKENKYLIIYDNIEGLGVSSPVQIRGFKVGRVTNISFSNKQYESLTVEISVKSDINIPKGTIAKVYSSDLMGSKSIELLIGTSYHYLSNGDTIYSEIEESLGEQVKLQMLPLKKKAESLMSSMDSVLAVVENILNKNTKENIKNSILSIRNTFQNLENSAIKIKEIVSEKQITEVLVNLEYITGNIRNHNKDIGNILHNISSLSDTLARAEIGKTLLTVNKVFNDFDSIATKIKSGEGTIGQLVNNDTLYFNLQQASSDLDSLLIDLKTHPKRYVHFSVFGSKEKTKNKND